MSEFKNFKRKLDRLDALMALPSKALPQWWIDLLDLWRPSGVPADKYGLRLAIRDGYLNFYRRGQSIAKVEFDRQGVPKAAIHIKYVDDGHGPHDQEYVGIRGDWIHRKGKDTTPYGGIQQLKAWIEVVDKNYAGVEKNFVDELVAANPNVIDLEMGLPAWKVPKTAPRIDLVEIVPTSAGPSVVFWEAKLTSDGRMRSSKEVVKDQNPEVLEQLADYREFLGSEERVQLVVRAYENTAILIKKLRVMADQFAGEVQPLGLVITEVANGRHLQVDCTPRLVVLHDAKPEGWAVHEAKLRSANVAMQMVDMGGTRKLALPG